MNAIGRALTRRLPRPLFPTLLLPLTLLLAALSLTGEAAPGAPAASVSALPVRDLSPARSEERIFFSDSLGRDMYFKVFLPPGYDSNPEASYPVLYMLHGLGGDYLDWTFCGLLRKAEQMMLNGEIQPMIIVTPQGDRGYWLDHANGGPRYGSYVVRDLVSLIDAQYRTIPTRESRAIGGMSMGAHGALQLAMNAPHQFGVIGAHSVALRRYEQAFSFFGDPAYFRTRDPVQLFRDYPLRARQFAIWLDIGTGDPWYTAAEAFHAQLEAAGIPHEWRAYPGGHNLSYWSEHTAEYLTFYSRALAGREDLRRRSQ